MPALAVSWLGRGLAGVWFPRRRLAAAGIRQVCFMVDLPHQIGPCQLVELGPWLRSAVRPISTACCVRAGATWEPGSRRWLLSPARAA
jgi:hypothetical protein